MKTISLCRINSNCLFVFLKTLKYGMRNSKIFNIWGGSTAPSPDPTPRPLVPIDRNDNFLFHTLDSCAWTLLSSLRISLFAYHSTKRSVYYWTGILPFFERPHHIRVRMYCLYQNIRNSCILSWWTGHNFGLLEWLHRGWNWLLNHINQLVFCYNLRFNEIRQCFLYSTFHLFNPLLLFSVLCTILEQWNGIRMNAILMALRSPCEICS